MLKYVDLMGEEHDKVQMAIDRLRNFEPPDGYRVAFSGGKDSQCIYHPAKQAGVKFDAHYAVTSVDPPELIYFIRRQYPDVAFDIPHDKDGKRISMWSLIADHSMPPTVRVRYCCANLKESAGAGRLVVTGVRWAESTKRKNSRHFVDVNKMMYYNDDNAETRKMVESCYKQRRMTLNPIIDWTDEDVWEYLNDVVKVDHCELYDQGFRRLGCIGCPMAPTHRRRADFERWPKYKALYLKAFGQMLEMRKVKKLETSNWETPEDVMKWWLEDLRQKKEIKGQEAMDIE